MNIDFKKDDEIRTTCGRQFEVLEVFVTSDGRDVDYNLQEFNAIGNEVGRPAWYSSKQIKRGKGGLFDLTHEFEENTAGHLLTALSALNEALDSCPSGTSEHAALCRSFDTVMKLVYGTSPTMPTEEMKERLANTLDQFRSYEGSAYISFDTEMLSQYIPACIQRFKHILGVAESMRTLTANEPRETADMLVQAAWLHDIGYSDRLKIFNFHPLDGAIFAMQNGYPRPIVAAVLFHTAAAQDTAKRIPILKWFYEEAEKCLTDEDLLFIRMVTYCDLHTGPSGERLTLDERLQETSARYGAEHPVTKFMYEQEPMFRSIIADVEDSTK